MSNISRARRSGGGSVVVVSLPVVEFTLVGTSRGVSILANVILTDATRKPVQEFSDSFWSDFRTLAIQELSLSFQKISWMSAFGIFILLSLGALAAGEQIYYGSVTLWVTASWFFHSGLIWLCPSPELSFQMGFGLYAILLLLLAIVSAIYKDWFQFAFFVLLFATACCLCPSYFLSGGESMASSLFLRSVNRYCRANLRGYFLSLVKGRFDLVYHLHLHFRREVRVNNAPAVNENEVPSMNEFRVFLFDSHRCFGRAMEWDSHCYTAKNAQHVPEGIPEQAWSAFLRDISDEIERHEKDSRKIPWITMIHIIISAAFIAVYRQEGINYLFPLHMTSPFISNAVFQRKMTKKFSMVDKLGCSILGSTYRVSYHSVRWFFCCDDYILFKREGSSEASTTPTSVGIYEEFFDRNQESTADEEEDSPA